MRRAILLIVWLGSWAWAASGQVLTAADTSYILSQLRFPSLQMDFTIKFSGAMLDMNTAMAMPDNPTLEELELRLRRDSLDIEAYIEVFYRLREMGQAQAGFPYLEQALGLANMRLSANRQDITAARQIATIFATAQRVEGVVEVWEIFVAANPDVCEGWWQLAVGHLQTGELAKAKTCIETAYAMAPTESGVYVAEMMHQMYSALYFSKDTSGNFTFAIDRQFLEQAIQAHPQVEAAKMALNGLDAIGVFFNTVITHGEQLAAEKPFALKLTAASKKTIKALESYCQSLLKRKPVNPYFAYKCLLLTAILQNDLKSAADYLQRATALYNGDPDMYKIMAFGYMPSRNWEQASAQMEQAIAVSKGEAGAEARLVLAKMYFEHGQYEHSRILLADINAQHGLIDGGDFRAAYGVVACLVKEGEWRGGVAVLDALAELRSDARSIRNYTWYWACLRLLQGKGEEVKPVLEQIANDADHGYTEEAKALLKRYF